MNPQIESLRIGFERIQDLRIQIFKESFHAMVLRICEDLLDSWKQVESRDHITNRIFFKPVFVIDDTNWIFLSSDLWSSNWYKSMDSQNSYTIPATLVSLPVGPNSRITGWGSWSESEQRQALDSEDSAWLCRWNFVRLVLSDILSLQKNQQSC